ncbi:MAG: DUF2953 domain-containing protein [Lachnospiraceae bacterium]|nr:DUF2953 domain-containing protein [Lachnospiraceae bacterium]
MLHIVLTILKILGIILLALLSLVLVLLLCVLFVPIRYSARIDYHGKLTADARVSFLFRMLSFRFQKNIRMTMTFRIFGINTHWLDDESDERSLKGRKKRMKQMEKETEMFERLSEEIHQKQQSEPSSESEETFEELQKLEKQRDAFVKREQDQKTEHMQQTIQESKISGNETEHSERISVFDRIKNFFSSIQLKIKYIFRRFCDTIRNIYEKSKRLKEVLQDETIWQAFRDVKTEAIRLLKHIRPRRIKGYLHFGFDSPCNTGKLYGFICMFYTVLPKNFLLQADFDQKVLEGDLLIKGRIQIYYLLIIALRLYRNDNLRQVMKKRRTYGRE